MKKDRDLEISSVEEMVLTILRRSELYGLEIINAVQEATQGKRRLGFGSLYPALHQLEEKGMVKGRWGDETPKERSGARRRYYKITGLGQAALREVDAVRLRLAEWNRAWGGGLVT